MGKNVGLTYGEFKFPSEQGFTGSAGKNSVKGYQRGGRVKRAKGGPVKKQMGGFMGPEREIAVDDVKITVPKKHGGYMKGGMHDKLKHEGKKMGYAYGGQVKPSDTSGEFKQKRGKMDSMDHGVQPAQKGKNEAEVEAGGNKRLKAGYKKGGGVHKVRAIDRAVTKSLKKIKGTMSEKDRAYMRRMASGKDMPKSVKAKGGLARFAAGGEVKKAVAAQ